MEAWLEFAKYPHSQSSAVKFSYGAEGRFSRGQIKASLFL